MKERLHVVCPEANVEDAHAVLAAVHPDYDGTFGIPLSPTGYPEPPTHYAGSAGGMPSELIEQLIVEPNLVALDCKYFRVPNTIPGILVSTNVEEAQALVGASVTFDQCIGTMGLVRWIDPNEE